MKATTPSTIIILLVLATLVLPGCFRRQAGQPSSGGGEHPVDASGRMVFNPNDFRHAANTPFYCFGYLDANDASEMTLCHQIQDWCVQGLQQAHDANTIIRSTCQPVDEVSCFSQGSAGTMISSIDTLCFGDMSACDRYTEKLMRLGGASPANVSACVTLDSTFQPTS